MLRDTLAPDVASEDETVAAGLSVLTSVVAPDTALDTDHATELTQVLLPEVIVQSVAEIVPEGGVGGAG
jgi:hypothetical protein